MKASELQHALTEGKKWMVPDDPTGPRIDKVRAVFSGLPPRQKILDVGCANGAILRPFAGTHEVHGVEISESLVKLAVANGIKAVRHNLEDGPLPYADKTFDAVFCGETIEHHVDTDWLVSEINRVLKPGGLLVLTFPNIRTLLSVGMMVFFDLPPMYAARYRSAHFRDFTLRMIKLVLRTHGFEFQRARGSAFYLPKLGEFGSGLANVFPSWAHTVIVTVKKAKDSVYHPEDNISELEF